MFEKKKRSLVDSINEGILRSSNHYIIWLDADFQHPPHYIKKFIKYSKKYDVIIFSRFLKNSKRFYDDNKNIKKEFTKSLAILLYKTKLKCSCLIE